MVVNFAPVLIHLIADYYVQNDWMALNKKKPGWLGTWACAVHCLTYTLPFLLVTQSWKALAVIGLTHFLIDRTQLVAWLIWAKNSIYAGELRCSWAEAKTNSGFHPSRPAFIAVWIGIITDNTFHLILNALALNYL